MNVQEEEYTEMVSVSTSISDLSGLSGNHHVHVYDVNISNFEYY